MLASRCLLLVLSICFASGAAAAESSTTGMVAPSAETLFSNYPVQRVSISPSGRFVALESSTNGAPIHLKIIDLDGQEPPRIVAQFSDHDVVGSYWLSDSWLVFNARHVRYVNDLEGHTKQWRVDRMGEHMKEVAYSSSDQHTLAKLEGRDYVDPDEAMPKPPERLHRTHYDVNAMRRAGTVSKEGKTRVYWLDVRAKTWSKIAEFGWLDAEFTLGYVNEKDELFVYANNPQTSFSEIRKFDFKAGKPGELVLALPGFDVLSARAIKDDGSNVVHGLRLLTDSAAVAWFNPTMRAIQDKVDKLLPGSANQLYANSYAAPRTVLIHSFTDRSPGHFLLYRVAEDKFERLAPAKPEIQPERMGSMELHRIKARDGADLPVWITKTDAAEPRPAVVLVHGGPWLRGAVWGWDAETQFLATRGYVVIQPEFRGSTGYGDKHYRAGWKQWGLGMQDDLVDALRFAVDKGWVDPGRVCIAGGSYGGYAVLMELARRSPMYRCGIAWSAVTDPRFMYEIYWSNISDDTKEYLYPALIGDPDKDAAMLKANSPIELASEIKSPLMLIYGNYDLRVPIAHGERLKEKLDSVGRAPEWVAYDREGHGWVRKKNQIDFWNRIEKFLAKHLAK